MRQAFLKSLTLIGLYLAVCLTATPAAASPGGTRSLNSFVATDFDGDHTPDFASVGARRGEGSGYIQDVQLRFGSLGAKTLHVRTLHAAHRLTARDLDGDSDRDLVLESFDREPLAVLVNDGSGGFHQVDLSTFGAQLTDNCGQSLEAPLVQTVFPEFILDSGPTAVERADADLIGPLPASRSLRAVSHVRRLFHYAHSSVRGPPSVL